MIDPRKPLTFEDLDLDLPSRADAGGVDTSPSALLNQLKAFASARMFLPGADQTSARGIAGEATRGMTLALPTWPGA